MMARTDAGKHGEIQQQLLARAVKQLQSHPGPAWCNVRNYDTITTRVLQDSGFTGLAGQELLVRDLRSRVLARARRKEEKAMVPVWG
jgi:hypothetical protein